MLKKLIIVGLAGMILGIIGARYLFVGSFLSLIPWGIVGLLIGLWCSTLKEAALVGGCYGFVLAFTFTWAGYQGAAPVLSRLPFFAILGVVGAICGIGLGTIGYWMRRKLGRSRGLS